MLRTWILPVLGACLADLPAQGESPAGRAGDNPYNLQPFHADFPVALEYPNHSGLEYDRSRRQALERIVANLSGNSRREAWQFAMEFFWRAPSDARQPLIDAMDRAFGNPSLDDVVKNTVEAMGKMADEGFDAALQRALEHKAPKVRQAALTALATSGKLSTLRNLFVLFPQMDGRARTAWLRAARQRLGNDAVPLLRELMMAKYHSSVRDQVLAETLLLPPAQAAEVLRGRWGEAIGEFKPIIAGVLHAAGDVSGTVWLRDALQGEDLGMLALAIRHSGGGELGPLRDSLLRLSSHPRADVRLELAKALTRIDGDDIAAVYELLASPDEVLETRGIALRELTRRGRPATVTAMLEELPTATGTRSQLLLNLLAQSGDPRAVAIFVERFEKAPPGEGRPFVQALAVSHCNEAADALVGLLVGPERLIDRAGPKGSAYTTITYLPTMLLNVRGSEQRIVDAYRQLPKESWRHRAALLTSVAGIAGDREDAELRARCLPFVREVLFDRSELPQLRVLALNLLTLRFLTIEDALQLKNTRHEETPQLRALFADFLNDYL
jgi:HEAT repeat protein